MKNYGKKNCIDCSELFQVKGSRHFRCSKCKKDNSKLRDTIQVYDEKSTWKFRKPDTISRSQIIRRNRKTKVVV